MATLATRIAIQNRPSTIRQRTLRAILRSPLGRLARLAGTSKLEKALVNAYQVRGRQVDRLQGQILAQMERFYQQGVNIELQNLGCQGNARRPGGSEMRYLTLLATRDANSIANTWNRDLSSQVRQLVAVNPGEPRDFYIREIEAWAAQRDSWKVPQIANMTQRTAQNYGRERFLAENELEPQFIFDGPPPAEEVCATHFAAGAVDFEYVKRNPVPVHINCPHTWQSLAVPQPPPCRELWRG